MKKLITLFILLTLTSLTQVVAAEENIERDLENYWTTDRELPVIEGKLYQKNGRFGLGLHLGLLTSEPFFWYNPVGLRLQYFFSEYLSLEVDGTFYGTPGSEGDIGLQIFTHKTEITNFFQSKLKDDFDPSVDLEDRFLWRANAMVLWSPFYGKWAFLNRKLSHFDVNFAIGGGVVQVERPADDHKSSSSVMSPELILGGGVGLFATESLTVRLDGRFYVYPGAESPSVSGFFERLRVPSEFILGASYLF